MLSKPSRNVKISSLFSLDKKKLKLNNIVWSRFTSISLWHFCFLKCKSFALRSLHFSVIFVKWKLIDDNFNEYEIVFVELIMVCWCDYRMRSYYKQKSKSEKEVSKIKFEKQNKNNRKSYWSMIICLLVVYWYCCLKTCTMTKAFNKNVGHFVRFIGTHIDVRIEKA